MHWPAARNDAEEIDDVALGKHRLFRDHPCLERRVFQVFQLLRPRQRFNLRPSRLETEWVDGPLPCHDDAIAAQGDLGDDVCAIVVLGDHGGNLFLQRHFLGD